MCLLAALLGNYILSEYELIDFYNRINVNLNQTSIEQKLRAIADYVRDLPSIELEVVVQNVFGSSSDPRCSKLRQSIQYYMNGTKEGFLHYKLAKPIKSKNKHFLLIFGGLDSL